MQIDLSTSEVEKIAQQATAAGFKSVEAYVAEYVRTLIIGEEPQSPPPSLSKEELEQSLAEIDLAMEQIKKGQVLTPQEARRLSHEKLNASFK